LCWICWLYLIVILSVVDYPAMVVEGSSSSSNEDSLEIFLKAESGKAVRPRLR